MDVVALAPLLHHAHQVVCVLVKQIFMVTSAHLARQDFMTILTAVVRFKIIFNEHIAQSVFNFLACGCSSSGASSTSCNSSGVCSCKSNFEGSKCTSCKAGFYDYPNCYSKNLNNFYCILAKCSLGSHSSLLLETLA